MGKCRPDPAAEYRVALLDHLESVADSKGMSLAYKAFDANSYEMGRQEQSARDAEAWALSFYSPRGISGSTFSVWWIGGELSHVLRDVP